MRHEWAKLHKVRPRQQIGTAAPGAGYPFNLWQMGTEKRPRRLIGGIANAEKATFANDLQKHAAERFLFQDSRSACVGDEPPRQAGVEGVDREPEGFGEATERRSE